MARSEKTIKKFLGITLFPQAGVALGMAITVGKVMGGVIGTLVADLTIFSVLIYELVGPLLTKMALTKAGEIDPEGKVSERNIANQLPAQPQPSSTENTAN